MSVDKECQWTRNVTGKEYHWQGMSLARNVTEQGGIVHLATALADNHFNILSFFD